MSTRGEPKQAWEWKRDALYVDRSGFVWRCLAMDYVREGQQQVVLVAPDKADRRPYWILLCDLTGKSILAPSGSHDVVGPWVEPVEFRVWVTRREDGGYATVSFHEGDERGWFEQNGWRLLRVKEVRDGDG